MTNEALAARLRAELVAELVGGEALRSPEWVRAFDRVPRHLFVPRFTVGGSHFEAGRGQDEEWLRAAYGDRVLNILFDTDDPMVASTSSMPSVMAQMLDALQVEDGARVLEVGTGSGYNAALLCERLGSGSVASVDIDVGLVDAARERLAGAGYTPHLAAVDGFDGYRVCAPYDRVIATCATRRVPLAWIEQTTPGGLVLAMLPYGLACLTVVGDRSAHGRFHPTAFDFMDMRGHSPAPLPEAALHELVMSGGESRPAGEAPAVVDEQDGRAAYWMLERLTLVSLPQEADLDPDRHLEVDLWDLSWILFDMGQGAITQGGPRRLWDARAALYDQWCALGRPGRERFGLSVHGRCGLQEIWLDDPGSGRRWPLVGHPAASPTVT
jgi:protein-L-isoaspartate(D-aspartate) O-methyltransferase